MLEIENVHVFYGTSHILFGVSLRVEKNEIVYLLGRNGAGKTTTFRAIMGFVRPRSGNIRLGEKEIAGLSPYSLARMGVGFVFEDRRLFPRLTVRENLKVATRGSREGKGWTEKTAYDMFPILAERRSQEARTLSGGEQQMLAFARTMMGNPKLVLIDEPTEGLAPLVVERLLDGIRRLKERGITVLVSEQKITAALETGDRCYVLNKGMVYFNGSMGELMKRDDVLHTYLGVQLS